MAAEGQGRLFDPAGQPAALQMVVEPAQTVDVDGPVVHPHALKHVDRPGRLLADKGRLVEQVKNVCHGYLFIPRSVGNSCD
jgi:hypothetical protein